MSLDDFDYQIEEISAPDITELSSTFMQAVPNYAKDKINTDFERFFNEKLSELLLDPNNTHSVFKEINTAVQSEYGFKFTFTEEIKNALKGLKQLNVSVPPEAGRATMQKPLTPIEKFNKKYPGWIEKHSK